MVLFVCLFVLGFTSRSTIFRSFWTADWVKPVLSIGDEVSCSRTQHRAPAEDRSRDFTTKSPKLSQLYYRYSRSMVSIVTVPFTLR